MTISISRPVIEFIICFAMLLCVAGIEPVVVEQMPILAKPLAFIGLTLIVLCIFATVHALWWTLKGGA